ETAGQFTYIFAISSNTIVAAPAIASYSIFSVILSRVFLKEKLSKKHYVVIAIVLVGIAILGIE
ncbi:MAG: EamA family transporter, partial [Oscillospiraceae bacterium]